MKRMGEAEGLAYANKQPRHGGLKNNPNKRKKIPLTPKTNSPWTAKKKCTELDSESQC